VPGHTFGPSAIRCKDQIFCGAIGNAVGCVTRRAPKTPKIEVFGVNYPLSVKFRNSVKHSWWRHRFAFYVQISGQLAVPNDALLSWQTFRFFRRHRAAVGRKALKFYKRASHLSPRFSVRFRPDRLSFTGVMSGKLHSTLVQPKYMPSAYNDDFFVFISVFLWLVVKCSVLPVFGKINKYIYIYIN